MNEDRYMAVKAFFIVAASILCVAGAMFVTHIAFDSAEVEDKMDMLKIRIEMRKECTAWCNDRRVLLHRLNCYCLKDRDWIFKARFPENVLDGL